MLLYTKNDNQSLRLNYLVEKVSTDYRFEIQGWVVLVDCTLPQCRIEEIRSDVEKLVDSLSKEKIKSELFENFFGGHFFVIAFHEESDTVWTLRDITGAKSGYFHVGTNGEFAVGSNVHEVAKVSSVTCLNDVSALHLLTIDYLLDGETFYEGVSEFPIGSINRYGKSRKFEVFKSFLLDLATADNEETISTNVSGLRNAILQSHERRFGDENIVLLSGGIDSSVMLCALREVAGRERVRAITFRVNGTPEDETGYAVALAKHLGVEIERIEIDPQDDWIASNLSEEVSNMNSPYFGRFIFGQFKGNPSQVYFAGQDTRLHTPDLNSLDLLAFKLAPYQSGGSFSSFMRSISSLARPFINAGWSSSGMRWKRGIVRTLLAADIEEYIPRFFFKLNPENLRNLGCSDDVLKKTEEFLRVDWRSAKNSRDLYNRIISVKWGEQYTDDMRYLQDVGRINNTFVSLPFYDIHLARFSSALSFSHATKLLRGQDKFNSHKQVMVNKYLLRQAFKSDMTPELYLRAKAVSRSQHLLFSGALGRQVKREIISDLQRSEGGIIRKLDKVSLAEKFINMEQYSPGDEAFLTKIYWLAVLAIIGNETPTK